MSFASRLPAFGVLMVLLCPALPVQAVDPSGRVARLNHVLGEASYSPAGEDAWLQVVRNRPLIQGDRLWTDADARLELQVGSAAVRLGPETSLELLTLDDRIAQLEVTEGTINLRVRRLYRGQSIEVATPTLAFTIERAGRYRIDVDPADQLTTIVVWEGAGTAWGDGANYPLQGGDNVRFFDTDLRDYEAYDLPQADAFDRYCMERDRRLDRSPSLRFVGDDVIGYADLDEYGRWSSDANYGNVWYPSQVARDWAPYRDGHWVWQEPWGWTWVDNAPWGFAPSHYGRWVSVSNRWGWIPGPRNLRATYAPALVAFVGGRDWSLSLSYGNSAPIGWFPLGPREAYVPSYRASREYFTRVNVNNTVINNTTITNVYNNYSGGNTNAGQITYANRTVAGAVTAVPSEVFVNARPVRQAMMNIDRRAVTSGEISRIAPIAPSYRSVLGAGKEGAAQPSRAALDRRVMARSAPPPEAAPFVARERELKRNPGRASEVVVPSAGPAATADSARQVRVITDQRARVNAREAGSTRADARSIDRSRGDDQLEQQARDQQQQQQRDRQQQQPREGRNNAPPQAQAPQAQAPQAQAPIAVPTDAVPPEETRSNRPDRSSRDQMRDAPDADSDEASEEKDKRNNRKERKRDDAP